MPPRAMTRRSTAYAASSTRPSTTAPTSCSPCTAGPVPLDQDTIDLRAEVHDAIQHVLHRGRQDGSIRPDVTALDIIVFGALLAQPLPHIPDWKLTARRLAAIHFDGLAGAAATATEQ